MIEREGLPRCQWRLSKVHELLESRDGFVRGVKFRVHNLAVKLTSSNRSVNKLCYIERRRNEVVVEYVFRS